MIKLKQLGNFVESKRKNPNSGRVYSATGIAPTINCAGGGQREPHIIEITYERFAKQQHDKDFDYDDIDVTVEEGKQNDPKYVDEIMHYIVEDSKIDLRPLMQDGYIYICINGDMYRTGIRIRKLTERECFRLMDLDDDDIDKIQAFRYPQDQTTTDCLGRILLNEEGKEQKQRKGKPISRTAQYRLAGNSIVVACLEGIFEQLFFPQEITNNVPKQLTLF